MNKTLIDKNDTLTNQQVGNLIGLTYSAVSRLRSGNRLPSINTMYAIEAVFSWPVTDQLATRVAMGGPVAWSQEFDRRISEHTTTR